LKRWRRLDELAIQPKIGVAVPSEHVAAVHLDQAWRDQMIADVGKAEPCGDRDGARAGGKKRGLGDAKAAAALNRDASRIGLIMRIRLVRIVKDRIANP
jgi:hypothetical protein